MTQHTDSTADCDVVIKICSNCSRVVLLGVGFIDLTNLDDKMHGMVHNLSTCVYLIFLYLWLQNI